MDVLQDVLGPHHQVADLVARRRSVHAPLQLLLHLFSQNILEQKTAMKKCVLMKYKTVKDSKYLICNFCNKLQQSEIDSYAFCYSFDLDNDLVLDSEVDFLQVVILEDLNRHGVLLVVFVSFLLFRGHGLF